MAKGVSGHMLSACFNNPVPLTLYPTLGNPGAQSRSSSGASVERLSSVGRSSFGVGTLFFIFRFMFVIIRIFIPSQFASHVIDFPIT